MGEKIALSDNNACFIREDDIKNSCAWKLKNPGNSAVVVAYIIHNVLIIAESGHLPVA